ncbi:hypothetical protein [uncultured Fibrobacter sp.]|uniref:hypothetical protein n=1 Tax=uncultured Fibrobacter sp. TaxID=261512 RepID=UPI0025DED6D3|nr:hypothetical protein [uncultured Fibrobacter sp.]
MDLYHIEDHSPGMVFWHPKGTKMVNALKDYIRGKIDRRGYQEVITPDSDARREQRTNSFVHCRAEELGCLHPNREQDFVDQVRPRRQVQREHVQKCAKRVSRQNAGILA